MDGKTKRSSLSGVSRTINFFTGFYHKAYLENTHTTQIKNKMNRSRSAGSTLPPIHYLPKKTQATNPSTFKLMSNSRLQASTPIARLPFTKRRTISNAKIERNLLPTSSWLKQNNFCDTPQLNQKEPANQERILGHVHKDCNVHRGLSQQCRCRNDFKELQNEGGVPKMVLCKFFNLHKHITNERKSKSEGAFVRKVAKDAKNNSTFQAQSNTRRKIRFFELEGPTDRNTEPVESLVRKRSKCSHITFNLKENGTTNSLCSEKEVSKGKTGCDESTSTDQNKKRSVSKNHDLENTFNYDKLCERLQSLQNILAKDQNILHPKNRQFIKKNVLVNNSQMGRIFSREFINHKPSQDVYLEDVNEREKCLDFDLLKEDSKGKTKERKPDFSEIAASAKFYDRALKQSEEQLGVVKDTNILKNWTKFPCPKNLLCERGLHSGRCGRFERHSKRFIKVSHNQIYREFHDCLPPSTASGYFLDILRSFAPGYLEGPVLYPLSSSSLL